MGILQKKSLKDVLEYRKSNNGLKKSLGAFDLFLMGLGAIIGAGIFVVAGVTAAELSGPAITISYLIAGLAAIFVALAYTEVASMIPTSGSVYTYTYVSTGEILAWVTGWMSLLYFVISATTVASGWSGYVVDLLSKFNIIIPEAYSKVYADGGIINLPAVFIGFLMSYILVRGTSESTKINNVLVIVKAVVIFIFIAAALPYLNTDLWNIAPVSTDHSAFMSSNFIPFGIVGVLTGASQVFFSYNGFDTIASAAEESKNPERDVTVGMLSALLVSVIIYMVIAGILVGIVPYYELDIPQPVAYALEKIGFDKISTVVSIGAIAGLTTVILMQLYSQSRILFAMSRDGMLPKAFSKIHPKYGTPYISNIILGIIVCALAGFIPLKENIQLASMGALFMFAMVALSMMILRFTNKDARRPFRCPLAFVVGPIAFIVCLFLLWFLLPLVGYYFLAWLALGLVVYFVYVRNFSPMALKSKS